MRKPAKSQLKKTLMAAGALILLTLAVYLPVIHCGYVWDDDFYVTANPLLTDTVGAALGQFPQAVADYESALKLDPGMAIGSHRPRDRQATYARALTQCLPPRFFTALQ
jgi:hypothetical protein